jgi:hypothetical protein
MIHKEEQVLGVTKKRKKKKLMLEMFIIRNKNLYYNTFNNDFVDEVPYIISKVPLDSSTSTLIFLFWK